MLGAYRGVLDLNEERHRRGVSLETFYGEVLDLERRLRVSKRELRLSNSLSPRSKSDKKRIRVLLSRYRDLPLEERRQRPALLNAIGRLAVIAGEFEGAGRHFQEVAALVTEPGAAAEAHYNAYVVALERSQWTEALAALRQAMTLDPERFAPFPTDKYIPQQILGVGGFCVAFLCRHRVTGSAVVIKGMLANDAEDERNKLLIEGRVLERVKHPAIIRLRDCEQMKSGSGLRPYLVLDYFEGPTLEEYVHDHGPLAAEDLLAVAGPVAGALRAAHARGIVHRDVKPGNILVRRARSGWKVRLIDFGLALQLDLCPLAAGDSADWAGGSGGEVVGTLDYAAPEQLGQAAGVAVGPYSDVYGFGKTCYYALLGTAKPTDEETAHLSAPWRELLGGCTTWNALDRYADCSPLLAELARMRAKARSERRTRRAVAYNNRGVVHSQGGELARAIADFSEALRLDPHLAGAYHNRGLTYATQGTYLEAIADFTRALALNPQDAAVYHFRGMSHGNLGDLDSAIADFSAAIRLNPEDPLSYRHRGAAYATKGCSALAECDYQAALRLEAALGQEWAG